MFVLLISCNKKEVVSENWDFTNKEFEVNSVRLLSGYDSFDFERKTDSILILNGAIFQGWKKQNTRFVDTLQLEEKYFVYDTLGNPTKEIICYSKARSVFLQLEIIKKGSIPAKEDIQKNNPPKYYFDYKGKLFIKNKNLTYFSDELWYK